MTELATSTRGDRVAYDRYGPTALAPVVVVVAGAGSLRHDDTTIALARLVAADGVGVVLPDRLGRGGSEASGRLDLDREIEGLRAVAAAAGDRVVLCGHSSGCALSLRAAARGLPVAGLALWEAPVTGSARDSAAWARGLERRLDDGELEQAQEWYMQDMPPEWLAGAKASPAWPAIFAGVVSLRADAQALRWTVDGLESGALRDEVGVPVLAAYGTSTFPGMVEAAERLRSVLPQTEVREIGGAHHAWDPVAFAPVLADFVRSCVPAA